MQPGPESRRAAAEARLQESAPGYVERVRAAAQRLGVHDTDGRDDARSALDAVEELSEIDVDVPTASRIPAARFAKRVIKRAIAWYVGYVGHQLEALGQAIARLGRVLLERTGRLEERTAALEAQVAELDQRLAGLESRDRRAE